MVWNFIRDDILYIYQKLMELERVSEFFISEQELLRARIKHLMSGSANPHKPLRVLSALDQPSTSCAVQQPSILQLNHEQIRAYYETEAIPRIITDKRKKHRFFSTVQ